MLVDLASWFVESTDTAGQVWIRAVAAGATAFFIGLILGPFVLRFLFRIKARADLKGDSARLDELSEGKKNTPIMGGLMLVPALSLALLLWGNLKNQFVVLALLGTLGFSLIGMIDDAIKMSAPRRKGITTLAKLTLQSLVSAALVVALWMELRERMNMEPEGSASRLLSLSIPYSTWALDLSFAAGIPFVLLGTLVMVGTSNGVNLSDGLDGLAPGSVVIASGAMGVVAYAVGRHDFADYLSVLYVRGAQEMTVVAMALAGSTLAFLWFNAYPAQVFLGDTGSLPLGGLLGFIAIVSRKELVFAIIGGVFVVESLSVLLQIASFKLVGRRVFRCAPLHHHFQFAGMHEVKIVVRFWIVGLLCAILGISTLKFG